jgi:hypothetical protein
MKKILLVTVLAVSASWAVRELRQSSSDPRDSLVGFQARHDDHRPSRIVDLDEPVEPIPPVPPLKPVEPPRPRSIRSMLRKPGKPNRPAPAEAIAKAPSIPSWFPKTEVEEESLAKPDASGSRVLVGRLSASEDRARQDLQKLVEREVSDWLAADVPPSWKLPAPLLESIVDGSYTQEVARNLIPTATESGSESEATATPEIPGLDGLYTLYRAGQKLDFSSERRTAIVAEYHRELATQRMQRLGGGLALALVGLAVLSGYIRADEATKGYYTNALRLAALAGLGASGVAAYRMFA